MIWELVEGGSDKLVVGWGKFESLCLAVHGDLETLFDGGLHSFYFGWFFG